MIKTRIHKPVDALSFLFLLFLVLLVLLYYDRIPDLWPRMARYFLLMGLLAGLVYARGVWDGPFFRFIHSFMPVALVALIYDSMDMVPYINPQDRDGWLIQLDLYLLGTHPTVWLERITAPWLTELMQVSYTAYYFMPIILAGVLYWQGRDEEFDVTVFSTILSLYISFIGYMLVPALGPRFALANLQKIELKGLLLAEPIRQTLDFLEGIKRDAFPSGHTAVVVVVLYFAHRYQRSLYYIFLPLVLALVFSTVYARYHYVVDVLAGLLLALFCVLLGPRLSATFKRLI